MADHIRYDLLTQQALRSVMRTVLVDTAKKGLPGDHHFFISFQTQADGVRMSDRLRAQYPEEMTIILQHQFWDLTVTETGFEVGMSFGGIPEKLAIPFAAVKAFYDPSVQFGLQFEEISDDDAALGEAAGIDANKPEKPKPVAVPKPVAAPAADAKPAAKTEPAKFEPAKKPVAVPPVAASVPSIPPAATDDGNPDPDKPGGGGGEVVRLDRFRKK